MAYKLGQYNKVYGQDDGKFMSKISDGAIQMVDTRGNQGVIGSELKFTNEACKAADPFESNAAYYFHGKILKPYSGWGTVYGNDQNFNIKLINYENYTSEGSNYIEQYIKQINVTPSINAKEWVDVEFIFSPLQDGFDTILFEMNRSSSDYDVTYTITDTNTRATITYKGRKAVIGYEELSKINNFMGNDGLKIKNFLRMGVQSRPGFLMCINNEGIRVPRTGVYELKEGTIPITSFSAINSSKEEGNPTPIQRWMTGIEEESRIEKCISECFFQYATTPQIDNFTLDYVYEEN